MNIREIKLLLYLFVCVLILTHTKFIYADPDFYHHRNILPGARASGLGGAYTALSDDPSGGYYNPAGLAFGSSKEISVSVNSRQEKVIRFKNIESLNGEDFVETSTTFFPSFVGSSYKFGGISLGWSYMTLDASNIDQSDRFEDLNVNTDNSLKSYNRTHQESNSYFLAGTSIAFPIGKYFSFGSSFFYYRRDVIATNHQLVQLLDGSFVTSDQKYTTLNEGMYPVLGALLKFSSFSIGISGRSPQSISNNTVLHSDGIIYQNEENANNTPVISSDVFLLKANDEVNPNTYQLGVAWTPSKMFLISSDILLHQKQESKSNLAANDLINTFNYSIGSELSTNLFIFRAGVFTNNSQAKPINPEKVNQPAHIDYLGYSFSLGIKQRGFNGNLIITEQRGSGEAQKLSNDPNIQEAVGYSRTVQLGATYDF